MSNEDVMITIEKNKNSDFPVVHDLMGLGQVGIVRDTVDLNVCMILPVFIESKSLVSSKD